MPATPPPGEVEETWLDAAPRATPPALDEPPPPKDAWAPPASPRLGLLPSPARASNGGRDPGPEGFDDRLDNFLAKLSGRVSAIATEAISELDPLERLPFRRAGLLIKLGERALREALDANRTSPFVKLTPTQMWVRPFSRAEETPARPPPLGTTRSRRSGRRASRSCRRATCGASGSGAATATRRRF